MLRRSQMGAIAFMAALGVAGVKAAAQEPPQYPDWSGQWERINGLAGGSFDPSKRPGRAQQPPLNAEYRAIWEANIAEAEAGGQSYNTQVHCLPGGMPRIMWSSCSGLGGGSIFSAGRAGPATGCDSIFKRRRSTAIIGWSWLIASAASSSFRAQSSSPCRSHQASSSKCCWMSSRGMAAFFRS